MAADFSNTGIEILGDVQLGKLFDELTSKNQNLVINAGFRKAGNIILRQVKENFKANFKTNGELNLLQYFQVRALKSKVGVRIGALGKAGKDNKSYITRILEMGSYKMGNRFYMSKKHIKHFTGTLKSTNFFKDAVAQSKYQAEAAVQGAIVDSMNRSVEKWSKMTKT